MTFTESYKQNLDKTRFLSKIASFLISAILLFDTTITLYNYLYVLPQYNLPSEYINENWQIDSTISTFQAFIAVLFTVRLVLLLLKKPKSVWLSQIIWLVGWLSIFAYLLFIYSQCGKFSAVCGNYLSFPKGLLETIVGGYFFFSPIKEIWTLLACFFPKIFRI